MTCTATFNLTGFSLTVDKAGTGSGTVKADGIDCGTDCNESYAKATKVALTATAAGGSVFAGWSGAGCGKTVLVNGDKTCTAIFMDTTDRIGIYRPATSQWFLDKNGDYAWNSSVDTTIQGFAATGAKPVIGEWDGAGLAQLGLFQPGTLQWYFDLNHNKAIDGCETDLCEGPFGEVDDIPISGRWDLKGYDRAGVFRPSTGRWYLDKNADGDFDGCRTDRCAYLKNYASGDLPVVGDWNGKKISQVGLFRPSTGEWFLDRNGSRSWNGCEIDQCITGFGSPGDVPVAGDWDGTGKSKIGVWRPATGYWYLDYNGNGSWDGCMVDVCTWFGSPGDVPVVGRW
jgi:hypothetical protein